MRAVLYVALLALCASTYSQVPLPSPAKSGKEQQTETRESKQEPDEDKSETKSVPAFVEVMPSRNGDKQAGQKGNYEDNKSFYDSLIAWATVGMAVVSALLAFFTAGLWLATKRLVEGTQDTAKRQLRAYVGISGFEFKCPNENNPGFSPDAMKSGDVLEDFIYVTIKNHGATPASDVHVWCRFAKMEFAAKLPKEHDITNRRKDTKTALRVESFATVNPGQTYSPRAGVAEAKRREASLYLYGAVTYNDIFAAGGQTTWFCYIYEPWHEVGDQFIPYERGNKAT